VGNVFKLNVLFDYEWTGNVRELRNVVRQAAVLTGEGEIDKKLAELVEKKITEAAKNQSQSSTSPRTQRPREFSSFVSSLLDDTRPKAESRLKKAYEQNLFLKANGNIQEMIKRARLKKTVISKIKAEIKNSLSFSQFEKDDLIDAASLATKLKRPTDPVSTYIYSRLNSHTRNMLNEYREGEPGAMLLDALVNDLNRQLQDHDLYQAERFQKIQLSEDTEDLIKQQGVWTDLFRLNRMLIEDTYPNEIRMSQSVRSVRDGSNEDRQPDSEEEGID
jgi:transcriptional regulator of acetoin/glycerol metabolism